MATEVTPMPSLGLDPVRGADFRDLYDRYAQATFGFFLRKVGDPALAADLNQNLFLKLSRSIGSFEGRCSWRTWISAAPTFIP